MKFQHKEKQFLFSLRHLPHFIVSDFLGMTSVTHSDSGSPEIPLHLLYSRYHCGSKEGADSSYPNVSASRPRCGRGPRLCLDHSPPMYVHTRALRAPPLSADCNSFWSDSPIYLCPRLTAGFPISGGHDHHTNVPAKRTVLSQNG